MLLRRSGNLQRAAVKTVLSTVSRFALSGGTQKSSGSVGQNAVSMKENCLLHYLQYSEEGVYAQAKQKNPTNPTPLLPAGQRYSVWDFL